jgi:hypothetical protein
MVDIDTEPGAVQKRSSPRTNKGQNPNLLTDRVPRKVKQPNQPAGNNSTSTLKENSNSATNSSATGHDSPDASQDSSATKGNSSDSTATTSSNDSSNENRGLSMDQLNALLSSKKVAWEKEDSNKTKKVLVKELNQTKGNYFVVKRNLRVAESAQKKTLENAQVIRAKYDATKARAVQYKNHLSEMGKIQDELKKIRAERDELQKKLQRTIKNKAMTRERVGRKHSAHEMDKALLTLIESKAKTILWGFVKFIQDPEEEMNAARCLIKYGDFADKYCPTKESKMEVAEMYRDRIKRAIFCKRNYTTAESKKFYVKNWKNGKPTLTVQDLKECLKRNIVTETDMEKFMMYWEEYLPKQVGAQEWDKNRRYYDTISDAKRKDCKSHELHLVTPEDEAFLVLSIENGLQRWREEFDKSLLPKVPGASEGAARTEKTKEDKTDYSGLFTSTTSGQNQYGGWSEQGLDLFKAYVDINIEARKDPKTAKLETDCLLKLRLKWGIQMTSAEEQNKFVARQKSARKRGREETIMPTMKRVVRTMRHVDFTDDEEEEEDDE